MKLIKGLTPNRLGQWAVITGGSSGIGFAHAQILAQHGFDLLLLGRDMGKLDSAKLQLERLSTSKITTRSVDLSVKVERDAVAQEMALLDIGVYIGNAGAPVPGWFTETPLEEYEQSVGLKISANLALSHTAAKTMKRNRRGLLLLVSSTGGLQGIPYLSNNAAAEAYLMSLGEALHYELKQVGVNACVLLPGPTKTPAFDKMASGKTLPMRPMSASRTAFEGLNAAMRGQPSWVAGRLNRVMARLMSRRMASVLMGSMMGRLFDVVPLNETEAQS